MDMMCTGVVGYPPLDLKTMRDMLSMCPPGEVCTVHMNSEGGDAFVSESIRALLAASSTETVCAIEGLCASAAMTIAMGCSRVTMTANSAIMIHRASTGVTGNSSDLASRLQMLEAVDAGLVALYVARTGRSERVVRAWLDAQTWFTAEEALDAGLIDAVMPATAVAANLGGLRAPAHIRAALDASAHVVQTTPMSLLDTIKVKLGLAKDAPEEIVLAAVEAAVTEPAPAAPVAPATLTAEDVARIVGEQLAAQRAAAEASATPDVVAAAHVAAATAAVERFITAGKITPAGRDKALAACSSSVTALNACVAYWESAPVVTGAPVKLSTVETKPTLTAFEQKALKATGISAEAYAKIPGLKRGNS